MDCRKNSCSDNDLIAAVRAGRNEAFVDLVARYKGKVFGLAVRFARDDDELDDLCQEVFIKVYEHIGDFRADSPFEHWLSRITTRTCYDALRRRRRERQNVPLEKVHHQIQDARIGRLEAVEQARNLLEWGLAKLRPEERLVVTLLELEEKTVREVAMMTGWSETNVKVRAFRARQKLKQILEKSHEK